MNLPESRTANISIGDATHARVAELERLLTRIAQEYGPSLFASSLSAEDMVITDVLLKRHLPVDIVTLDTGRLHADTLQVIDAVQARYGYTIRRLHPQQETLADFVARHGRDAFYASTELRKRCCEIRKIEPLRVALAGRKSWITGQRRTQAVSRSALPVLENDTIHGMVKFNPLAEWSEADVWSYLHGHAVPYNRLYEHGYRSIGCAPCTRPTVAGEHVRAGRWWWEEAIGRECGLHVAADGRLVRAEEAVK